MAESSSQADEGGRRPAFLDPKDPASTASLTDLAVLSEEDEEGVGGICSNVLHMRSNVLPKPPEGEGHLSQDFDSKKGPFLKICSPRRAKDASHRT